MSLRSVESDSSSLKAQKNGERVGDGKTGETRRIIQKRACSIVWESGERAIREKIGLHNVPGDKVAL